MFDLISKYGFLGFACRLSWPVLKPDNQLSVYVMPSNSPHNFDCQLAESSREELPLLQVCSKTGDVNPNNQIS